MNPKSKPFTPNNTNNKNKSSNSSGSGSGNNKNKSNTNNTKSTKGNSIKSFSVVTEKDTSKSQIKKDDSKKVITNKNKTESNSIVPYNPESNKVVVNISSPKIEPIITDDKGKELITNNELNGPQSLEYLLEDYASSKNPELIPEILKLVKENDYSYESLIQFCPQAFYLFLKNGDLSNKDFLVDLPHIILDYLRSLDLPWITFISALSFSNIDFNKEIYIEKVERVDRLLDVYRVGFVDHRLEHSIITIQRLIRYHLNNKDLPPEWLLDFNEKHHAPEEHWKEHHIHLKSIKEIKPGLPDNAENNIMYWNRQLIPEYLFDYYLCSKGNGYDIEIYCDLTELLNGTDNIGLNHRGWFQVKQDKIRALVNKCNTDDDIHKLRLLVNYYFSNLISGNMKKLIN